jgi:PAS domain S-box-containing protein
MTRETTHEELKPLVEEQTYELEKIKEQYQQKVNECTQQMELSQLQRDLSISIASANNLIDGLHISLEAALKVSGMDCGGIYLFDKATGDLNLIVHQGLTEEFIQTVSHYDKDSEHSKYVKTGNPAYTLRKDLNVSMTPLERREGIKAFITLPLLDEGKVIGCLNLASHTFGDISLSVRVAAETVAAQIGSEIARLNAAKALQESEEHLRSLMDSAINFAVYRLVSDESNPNRLRVVLVSPSAKGILGVSDPMKFETWFEGMHPDDVSRVIEANQQAFETHKFNEEYRTYNGVKGEWRWVHAISTGVVDKNGRTRYVNGILMDITERKLFEEAMRAKDKELEAKAKKLSEINSALNILLEKREEDKIKLEEKILANIEKLIKPYLSKLQRGQLNERNKDILNIISTNLDEILSSFARDLSSIYHRLTPKEIQISNLIRQGNTNKEIADVLAVSRKTIEFHRDNIREKLGIKNKKINLNSYLLSID